ncbi:hypothetical protein [Actinacidiphila acididurans]|uniref:hypothetical protein n=1 Tax=Actinacidiphila acididurans TaxID=2784346 RepID=UPI00196589D1|nr:hypothetical protein [Actinacidiphila acididurans]
MTGGALALLTGCTLGTHSSVSATAPAYSAPAPPPVGSIEHPRPVDCVDGLTFGGDLPPSPPATSAPATTRPPTPPGQTDKTPGSDTTSGTGSTTGAATDTGSGTDTGTGAPPGTVSGWAAGGGPHGSPSPTLPKLPSGPRTDVTVGPLTWKGLRALATADQRVYGTHNSDGWHYRIGPDVHAHSTVTVTVGVQQRARAGLEYGGGYGTTPAPAVTFNSCPTATTTFPGGFFIAGDGRACLPLDVRVGNGPAKRVVISFFNGRCSA